MTRTNNKNKVTRPTLSGFGKAALLVCCAVTLSSCAVKTPPMPGADGSMFPEAVAQKNRVTYFPLEENSKVVTTIEGKTLYKGGYTVMKQKGDWMSHLYAFVCKRAVTKEGLNKGLCDWGNLWIRASEITKLMPKLLKLERNIAQEEKALRLAREAKQKQDELAKTKKSHNIIIQERTMSALFGGVGIKSKSVQKEIETWKEENALPPIVKSKKEEILFKPTN